MRKISREEGFIQILYILSNRLKQKVLTDREKILEKHKLNRFYLGLTKTDVRLITYIVLEHATSGRMQGYSE